MCSTAARPWRAAAGCLIVGGHSIDDAEPKYGLAVVGTVDPARSADERGAREPGDALVLTKPIGLGVISTAVKQRRRERRAASRRRSR